MNEPTNTDAISADTGGSKPLLLLDVDGVIKAFPDSRTRDYTRRVIDGYPIHFHREVPQMVSALEQAFEIVWFTLWNHRAALGIGPHVGLSDADHRTTSWERGWDVAYAAGTSVRGINAIMYAKTPLLPELVSTERHWVWIDDAHSGFDREYLVHAGFDPRRFRLVRTNPETGLAWTDVDRALEFARAVVSGAELPIDDSVEDSSAGTSTSPAVGPGSTLGRATGATPDDGPSSAAEVESDDVDPDDVDRVDRVAVDRDDVDREFLDLMARLGDDGSDVCSYCGGEMRPVVYGLPSPELFEEADKGDVILGGCCIPSSPAQTRCIDCGHEAPRYVLRADLW